MILTWTFMVSYNYWGRHEKICGQDEMCFANVDDKIFMNNVCFKLCKFQVHEDWLE